MSKGKHGKKNGCRKEPPSAASSPPAPQAACPFLPELPTIPPSLPPPRHGAEALDLCLTSILGREFGSIRQRSKLNVQVGGQTGLVRCTFAA